MCGSVGCVDYYNYATNGTSFPTVFIPYLESSGPSIQ